MFLTACLGIVSAHCASCGMAWVYGCHHMLMLLLLFCQVAALCYFLHDDEEKSNTKYARTPQPLGCPQAPCVVQTVCLLLLLPAA